MEKARAALEFNRREGLYSDDPQFIRVYATFDGGKYDGQIASIKSLAMLDKYIAEGHDFKDWSISTTQELEAMYFEEMRG